MILIALLIFICLDYFIWNITRVCALKRTNTHTHKRNDTKKRNFRLRIHFYHNRSLAGCIWLKRTKQTGTKHLEDTIWGPVQRTTLAPIFFLLLLWASVLPFFVLPSRFVTRPEKKSRMHQEQEKMWTDDSKSLENRYRTVK